MGIDADHRPEKGLPAGRLPTLRDLMIAAEQPGETDPWVLEYLERSQEAREFVQRIKELQKYGEEREWFEDSQLPETGSE